MTAIIDLMQLKGGRVCPQLKAQGRTPEMDFNKPRELRPADLYETSTKSKQESRIQDMKPLYMLNLL